MIHRQEPSLFFLEDHDRLLYILGNHGQINDLSLSFFLDQIRKELFRGDGLEPNQVKPCKNWILMHLKDYFYSTAHRLFIYVYGAEITQVHEDLSFSFDRLWTEGLSQADMSQVF